MSVTRWFVDFAGSMIENGTKPEGGDWVSSEDHDAEVSRMRALLAQAEELLEPEAFGEDEGYVWEVLAAIQEVLAVA